MKKCIFCKTDNIDEAKYCQKCGHSFEITCPKCGAVNTGDAIYCVQCGASVVSPKFRKNKVFIIILSSILGIAIIGLIIAFLYISKKHTSSPENVINKDTIVENVDSVRIVNIEKETDTPTEDNESEKQNNNVNVDKVTDIDGNIYNTVKIGNQVWMKENMRTTKTRNGTPIPLVNTISHEKPYRAYPNDESSNVSKYGYLYNWSAATKICPIGWHLPSKEEFQILIDYCSDNYAVDGNRDIMAKSLAAATDWCPSSQGYTNSIKNSVGDDLSCNNKSNFSALPAGEYIFRAVSRGSAAYFWSDTKCAQGCGYALSFGNRATKVGLSDHDRQLGMSVRCIRD